ncbi:MAG: PQQ-like beta-propeller repeat protein [Planctomycetes bacterium]|jgi:outer membrane protein assembly factor BamB|nr:PQQ-like beta-propeller repeat protein [Planctomycetota bacterium]
MRRFVLALLLFAGPASADEVVLSTGAVLTGTVLSEDDQGISIRTDLGTIRVGRDRVAEVRRNGAGTIPPAPAAAPLKLHFRIEGIDGAVTPASTGTLAVVALETGIVVAIDPASGAAVWSATPESGRPVGFAADPTGVHVATGTGRLERYDPRNGRRLWSTVAASRLDRPPLLTRHGLFAFAPEEGLVGLDPASGRCRGTLLLHDLVADSPLVATEDTMFLAEAEGAIVAFGGDGASTRGYYETGLRPHGAAPKPSGRRVVVTAGERLVLLDETAAELHSFAIPGLLTHPLGADPVRAFVALGGGTAAVDLRTGCLLWRNDAAGRLSHLVVDGPRLVATTTGERLVVLSPADGRILTSADLGAGSASPPLLFGARILAITVEGDGLGFEPDSTPSPPDPVEKGPVTFRSPDGYRFALPAGWAVHEPSIRADVSVAVRPRTTDPLFAGLDAMERSILATQTEIAVRVLPAPGTPMADFREVPVRRPAPGRVLREAVRQIDAGRLVTLSFLCPDLVREIAEPAFREVLGTLIPDDDEPVPEDVRVSESVLDALNRSDLEPALPFLGTALWKEGGVSKPGMGGTVYRPLERRTVEGGRFRRLRVRIDDPSGTRFGDLLLGRESGGWVVTDWSALR